MDYRKLYNTVENKRMEGENLSFPFLVQMEDGKTRFVWFAFDVAGNLKTGAFVHINRITVLQEDEKTSCSVSAAFDTPFLFDPDNRERYMEYLEQVVQLQERFDEEEMNRLLQDYGMKPFFHAFQCVRNYVRTHTASLMALNDRTVREKDVKAKAAVEKLMTSLRKKKNVSGETLDRIEKAIAGKEEKPVQ